MGKYVHRLGAEGKRDSDKPAVKKVKSPAAKTADGAITERGKRHEDFQS